MHIDWIVDNTMYAQERLDRPSAWSVGEYVRGFKINMINRRPMYKDELDDLEKVYTCTLDNLGKRVEDTLPSLLYYMEEFLKIHKQNEAVREKLDVLLSKTGRRNEDDAGGDDE